MVLIDCQNLNTSYVDIKRYKWLNLPESFEFKYILC